MREVLSGQEPMLNLEPTHPLGNATTRAERRRDPKEGEAGYPSPASVAELVEVEGCAVIATTRSVPSESVTYETLTASPSKTEVNMPLCMPSSLTRALAADGGGV